VPPEIYTFSCSCVYMRLGILMVLGSSLEESSLKKLGVTTTVKIEGQSKTPEAWMLRPGGKKWDRHCF